LRARRRRRDLIIGVSVGLLVTLGATSYVLNNSEEPVAMTRSRPTQTASVRLTVTPPWAAVKFNDQTLNPIDKKGGFELTVSSGSSEIQWLDVAANGYHTVRRPISVFAGVQQVNIDLVRKPYEVSVRTEPAEAEVWLNEQLKGYSPVKLTLLPWEESRLSVRRAGYVEKIMRLEPPDHGGGLELDLDLEPAGILVRVESDPPGAAVAIDGKPSGLTPLDVGLEPSYLGKAVTVTASLPGYESAATTLRLPQVVGDEALNARLILQQSIQVVASATNPPSASRRMNGQTIARTPLESTLGPSRVGRKGPIAANDKTDQRVVFVLLSPTGIGADRAILVDHLVEQIHQLEDGQEFAVLACDIDGLTSWPQEGQAGLATSDQKIRAYDVVRSIRPAARGHVEQALRAAAELKPDAVWLYAAGNLDRAECESWATRSGDGKPTVNVVKVDPGPKDAWLASWAEARNGALTILSGPRPALASDMRSIE